MNENEYTSEIILVEILSRGREPGSRRLFFNYTVIRCRHRAKIRRKSRRTGVRRGTNSHLSFALAHDDAPQPSLFGTLTTYVPALCAADTR